MLERRKARKTALELLYAHEITSEAIESVIDDRAQLEGQPVHEFARCLSCGVTRNQDEVDDIIRSHTDNWALERMPILDRNIIRIAIYEMLHELDIPPSVSINEAVELAKLFGTEDSSRFVNGILGKIAFDLGKVKVRKRQG